MAARAALLFVPTALMMLPAVGFSQAPAAQPEIEQALRARVTEFFQDFVDQKFRQAINLVAEDTQDAYFSSPKAEYKAFKIDWVEFSEGFTKAEVRLTVKQVWKLKAEGFMQDQLVDTPMSTSWKIEAGKWVFYQPPLAADGFVTPMGRSQGFTKPDGSVSMPKKLDEATLNTEADRLLHQTGVDKTSVILSSDKPSTARIVFHNGAQGSVYVTLDGLPKVSSGLNVALDKHDVTGGQDAIVEIGYDPKAAQGTPATPFELAIDVAPFDQRYVIRVAFQAPSN
jgi:hypothetical protein